MPEEMLKSVGSGNRDFWFLLTAEVEDIQNDLLKVADIYKMMNIFKQRGAPIHIGHMKGKHVGKGTDFYPLDLKLPSGHIVPAILGKGEIFQHYRMDKKAWEDLYKGDLTMVSIGTLSYLKKALMDDEGHSATLRADFEPFHIALDPAGANPISYVLKVGDKSFMDRLTSQGIELMPPKELAKTLQSISCGMIASGVADEIAKAISDTPMEEQTMETEAMEKALEGLTAESAEMKKAISDLADIVKGQAVKYDELEKSLKFPPNQLGGKQKKVGSKGEKPVLKTAEAEEEVEEEVVAEKTITISELEAMLKSISNKEEVVAEGESPDGEGEVPDELTKAIGNEDPCEGLPFDKEHLEMMEKESKLKVDAFY